MVNYPSYYNIIKKRIPAIDMRSLYLWSPPVGFFFRHCHTFLITIFSPSNVSSSSLSASLTPSSFIHVAGNVVLYVLLPAPELPPALLIRQRRILVSLLIDNTPHCRCHIRSRSTRRTLAGSQFSDSVPAQRILQCGIPDAF